MIASARQRARRALLRLSLTEAQAQEARRLLRDDRRQLEAARELLAECRRQLGAGARRPRPGLGAGAGADHAGAPARVEGAALQARLEQSLAALLRPAQAMRLHGLAPAAVGDLLGRICG